MTDEPEQPKELSDDPFGADWRMGEPVRCEECGRMHGGVCDCHFEDLWD